MIPALFLSHGSPLLAIEDSEYTDFLARLGKSMRPKAVVVFTAHWEEPVTTISRMDGVYDTIYDFGGFPPEMYTIKYPAKGSIAIADGLAARLGQHGIQTQMDVKRGLDHGSWTLLRRLYPEADVPVVQMSVHPFLPPAEQFRIGEALRGLGEEGILVLGSGATVHNLRQLRWDRKEPEEWAVEFDDWLIDKIGSGSNEELFRYRELAPHAERAVPREEHFVPLLLAFGSKAEQSKGSVIYRGYDYGSLSYLCLSF
ncbi:dioxygenase [Paenibacillus sambharensis]|uniref:Dioxygenase n=1 Tax=Paenibacillus sambharensis TaxID=1803190 RepID=A0A2W1LIB6_9BACL|nr:class III extradiol ring-cleavage dioxygenase [Paenibacillus sambharensis]PZD97760.1 dioxygenase [Paenibacillus sambharensis]